MDEGLWLMGLKIGNSHFIWEEKTYIMGILNVTPDSFSDGGQFNTIEKAVNQAIQLENAGADIIDIGGESTRPDHLPISVAEEIERVLPIIRAVKDHVNIPISIDTYKAETAEAALQAGAHMINDIWGARKDLRMANIAKAYQVPIILMHNRDDKRYHDLIGEIISDLHESLAIVKKAGINDSQIILDPGIGFGKTLDHNFHVMNHLDDIIGQLDYPFLLGASRKSFINKVLNIPAEKRDNATGATTCLGIAKGVNIVRVHDVEKTLELTKMMDAMLLKGVDAK